jgi:rfaE bifunctional protein nucleotidyltransferase chain/domain
VSVTAPQDKILPHAALLARYGPPRDQRIVFTNGCFDVLHRGHVAYLERARHLGDVLVVGVNTDASMRRLGKGPGRPLVAEADRAYVLAALECVDVVTLFDEDTPRELVAALVPDVLVKGGDYELTAVVGREEVEAAGGRVVLIPYVEGYSTSELIRRMREGGR